MINDERPLTKVERAADFKVVAYLNSNLQDAGVVANLMKAMLEEIGLGVAGLMVVAQGGEDDP